MLKYVANVDLFIPFTIVNNIWDYVWWTWDLGVPNLININLTLTNINTTDFIEYHIITGIRTINVSQVHDQSSNATSFIFNLNGYDIYLRGGNYIPP